MVLGTGHAAPAHSIAHRSRSTTRSTPSPPALAPVTTEVLQQVASQRWTATVALTSASTTCPARAARFWLVTTSPDRVIPAHTVSPATGARNGHARCAQVAVHFTGLGRIPASATLEFWPAGAALPSSVQLTVSRRVTFWEYLAIPLAVGVGMAAALFICVLVFVRLYNRDEEPKRILPSRAFWQYIVLASGAWTANDSWATNIAAIVAFLGTVLAAASATNSLFPGVALDRFSILTALTGAIVVSVPLVFAPLYARWTAKNPGVTEDAVITPTVVLCAACTARMVAPRRVGGWLSCIRRRPEPEMGLLAAATSGPADFGTHDGDLGPAISAPAGATITMPASAVIASIGSPQPTGVKAGTVIGVPLDSRIRLIRGASMALPGGSDILASGDIALLITGRGGGLTVPATDIATASPGEPPGTPASTPGDKALRFPVFVTAPAVTITVAGAGELTLPDGTQIAAPRRPVDPLHADRVLPVPQASSSALVANMGLVLIPALITMLGVGALLGTAGVLAFGLSDGTAISRWLALAGLAVLAGWTIYYSTTAIRALADPQPGSSLSADPALRSRSRSRTAGRYGGGPGRRRLLSPVPVGEEHPV